MMIRNIPNKYTISALLEEINFYYKGKFDFLYLPTDPQRNNSNLGFAFINFIDPLHILMFIKIFSSKRWKKYNSTKQCELSYAKFQGKKDALSAHFEKSLTLNTIFDEKNPYVATPKGNPLLEIPNNYYQLCRKYLINMQVEMLNDRFVLKSFIR